VGLPLRAACATVGASAFAAAVEAGLAAYRRDAVPEDSG